MRHSLSVRVCLVVALVGLGMLLGRTVLASNGSTDAFSARNGHAQEAVRVVSSNGASDSASTTFGIVTSATITIPAGHNDLITVDFFAASACTSNIGGPAGRLCLINLRTGSDSFFQAGQVAFDAFSAFGANEQLESHAVSSARCVAAGASDRTIRVLVDFRVNGADLSFRVQDWTLKITRSHNCTTGAE